MGKAPPPKVSAEFSRFKNLLRKIVAVPKKEADEKLAAYREQRGKAEPEPET